MIINNKLDDFISFSLPLSLSLPVCLIARFFSTTLIIILYLIHKNMNKFYFKYIIYIL